MAQALTKDARRSRAAVGNRLQPVRELLQHSHLVIVWTDRRYLVIYIAMRR